MLSVLFIFSFVPYAWKNVDFHNFKAKLNHLESDIHWELDSGFLSIITWIYPNSLTLNPNDVFVRVGFLDVLRKGSRAVYYHTIDYDVMMREKYGKVILSR